MVILILIDTNDPLGICGPLKLQKERSPMSCGSTWIPLVHTHPTGSIWSWAASDVIWPWLGGASLAGHVDDGLWVYGSVGLCLLSNCG